MAEVSVRPARAEDIPEIARIQIETWRHGYANLLPQVVLDALSVETATSAWTAAIEHPPTDRHRVLVAMEQQWHVGFAATAPAEDLEPTDTDPDTTIAISPLLVEPRWGRRGHGSRLLAACIDLARADGQTRAVVWIPEGDTTSREFFLSAGWAPDGLARVLDTGAGELREIRLHTEFGDEAA
jgi:GNAT superfamily N-acetyltransferase